MELAPLLVVVAPFQFLFALAQVADLGGGGGGVVADDDALVLVVLVLTEALEDHLAVVDLDLYGPALDTRNRSIEKFRFPFSFVLKTFFFIKKKDFWNWRRMRSSECAKNEFQSSFFCNTLREIETNQSGIFFFNHSPRYCPGPMVVSLIFLHRALSETTKKSGKNLGLGNSTR